MKNKEKMRMYLQRDFELIFVLNCILLITELFLFFSVGYLLYVLANLTLLGLGIYFAKKGEKAAGIFGIIVGILMILGGALITGILGIFMTIHSIIYLVNYNKN